MQRDGNRPRVLVGSTPTGDHRLGRGLQPRPRLGAGRRARLLLRAGRRRGSAPRRVPEAKTPPQGALPPGCDRPGRHLCDRPRLWDIAAKALGVPVYAFWAERCATGLRLRRRLLGTGPPECVDVTQELNERWLHRLQAEPVPGRHPQPAVGTGRPTRPPTFSARSARGLPGRMGLRLRRPRQDLRALPGDSARQCPRAV